VPHELGASREAELLHDVRAMGLRRADRDEEKLRDLLVRVPEREQPQHLSLTVGERIGLGACLCLGLCGGEPRAERRVDVASSARDVAHRLDELVVRGLLEQVAGGAGREGLAHVARVVLHRENEDLRLRRRLEDVRRRVETASARHDDVEKNDVGLVQAGEADRLFGVSGLVVDLDVGLRFEQETEPRPDKGVVVDHKDVDVLCRDGCGLRWAHGTTLPSRRLSGLRASASGRSVVSRSNYATDVIREGEQAPDFTLESDAGEQVSLSALRGKPVVLYFYPKDDTPGCTAQACGIRDAYGEFERAGAVVLGVSPDSVSKHVKFKSKYDLPFTLLADPEHELAERYGVWGEKKYMGRSYMGVSRTTFVIDADGAVVKVMESVKPATHADDVLAALS
jgi:peroxiredoxin Q/BCP